MITMKKGNLVLNGKTYYGTLIQCPTHRCLECGNGEVLVWDCGYSTFNPGGAICTKCQNSIEISNCSSSKDVMKAWNKVNITPQEKIYELDREIEKITKEKKRLKKLFNL